MSFYDSLEEGFRFLGVIADSLVLPGVDAAKCRSKI